MFNGRPGLKQAMEKAERVVHGRRCVHPEKYMHGHCPADIHLREYVEEVEGPQVPQHLWCSTDCLRVSGIWSRGGVAYDIK